MSGFKENTRQLTIMLYLNTGMDGLAVRIRVGVELAEDGLLRTIGRRSTLNPNRHADRRTETEPRFVDNFADDNQLHPFSFTSISTQPLPLGCYFVALVSIYHPSGQD